MLRSFSYAESAALFAHQSRRVGNPAHAEAWGRVWQVWAWSSFLKGYFAAVGNALFVPTESSQRDELLKLFVLAKALYELNYELNNRPDWVRIPLTGILDMLEGR
jgi:predicted trehalose synthase